MQDILEKTTRLLKLGNYNPKTIKSYLLYIKNYITFSKKSGTKNIQRAIEDFLLNMQADNKSPQTINLALNAVKFLYSEVLKSPQKINLKFAKRSKKLPIVLSKDEIGIILDKTENSKHRLMIVLAYGCGLRVSEVTNLKVADLNLDELIINVREAKGRKDRISVLPKKLIGDLKNIIAGKGAGEYVFDSIRGGRLTTTSLQKMFRKSLSKTNVKKPATFHSLRHSFATHLMENGVDVRYVQELLGHANIRTTQLYTRVTNPKLKNIKSPL